MLLCAVSVFSLVPGFSSYQVVDESEISLNERGERVYRGQLFSGETQTYFQNGKLASADQFEKGRRQGFSKKWFEDGVLAFESLYKSGLREGFVRSWWFNGNKRSETFFRRGKAEGVGWRWYRNGKLFKQYNFVQGQHKACKKHGA